MVKEDAQCLIFRHNLSGAEPRDCISLKDKLQDKRKDFTSHGLIKIYNESFTKKMKKNYNF